MGIYARVNSRHNRSAGFQQKIQSFVIVLCSRLTAANNELGAGDNKAGTIMTARREPIISYRHLRNAHSHCHALENCPLPPPPLAKCWRNTKGKGKKNEGVHAPFLSILNAFACVFFSNLIFRPSDIQPRRSFPRYRFVLCFTWIRGVDSRIYVFLNIFPSLFGDDGHDDVIRSILFEKIC